MDPGRIFFDPSDCHGNTLLLGSNDPVFQGPRWLMSIEENPAKKPPFFTSQDELINEEEYYDDQLPEKKRRLTPEQVMLLEKSFEEENKLEPERKSELAKKLGLQPRQVAVWFQNRRARWKTKRLERDYDLLKASYDTLLSNYESILKDNEMLKSQVQSLTEKIQVNKEVNKPGPRTESDQITIIPEDKRAHILTQQFGKGTEDRLSSGSGPGSAVVNNEAGNPYIMVESEDCSYFDCLAPPCIPAVQSEEDDISDDGRSYFSGMFAIEPPLDHQQEEEEEGHALGWWVWS